MPTFAHDQNACDILSYECKYKDEANEAFSGLCDAPYFDELTGIVDAMDLLDPGIYDSVTFPKTVTFTIETVSDDEISNQEMQGSCEYEVVLDPCLDSALRTMKTMTPFPFADKIYRLNEPDLEIAAWESWKEIVDSHLGNGVC